MLPAGGRPATSWVHYTTSCNTHSSAPEDGQINCPKHVQLIGIINKPLLLHQVGCLYYLYQWCTVNIVASSWLSILFISMMHGQANINNLFILISSTATLHKWDRKWFLGNSGWCYTRSIFIFYSNPDKFVQSDRVSDVLTGDSHCWFIGMKFRMCF